MHKVKQKKLRNLKVTNRGIKVAKCKLVVIQVKGLGLQVTLISYSVTSVTVIMTVVPVHYPNDMSLLFLEGTHRKSLSQEEEK